MSTAASTRLVIDTFVRSVGGATPEEAIRLKAREIVGNFCTVFGEPTMPFPVDALASFLGIGSTDEPPVHSDDAELIPIENGRVAIRVNPDRPETRKRFSMAHEVTHTFFPDYQSKIWCRTDARFRSRRNPDDLLEMLCDIGASEIAMPLPWFASDARAVATGADLAELARKYATSREATLRRYAETSGRSVHAVFFSWRLKPAERRRLTNPLQERLFDTPDDQTIKKLRLDYSIPSNAALDAGYYLPPHKSVESQGPLYMAAVGTPSQGQCRLDLGPAAGLYNVIALPVWTREDDLGPARENAVGAIIEPFGTGRKTRLQNAQAPSLF
jgi:IrrE N-terminal-like domain